MLNVLQETEKIIKTGKRNQFIICAEYGCALATGQSDCLLHDHIYSRVTSMCISKHDRVLCNIKDSFFGNTLIKANGQIKLM